MRISIPFGKECKTFSLPDNNVGRILKPRSLPPLPDVGEALREALTGEHCAFFLSQLERKVRTGRDPTVAIAVNDYTRPTPLHSVLPPLLDLLNARGVADSRIRIVVALGTHRPMTREEFCEHAGEQVLKRVGFINPDIDDTDKLRYIAPASFAGPVWVNREYAEADIKIAVGTILPHGAVGFSGGAKLIVPGIAGRRIVEEFHVAANRDPKNQAGRLASPIRAVIEEFVELVGLHLMINLVVDSEGKVCGLTAGHYITSHRKAVPLVRKLYGLPLPSRAGVLVVGSAPADLDFWQAAKAIFNCQAAVKRKGWLVLVTPCPGGIPAEHGSFHRCIGLPPEQIEVLLDLPPLHQRPRPRNREAGMREPAAADVDMDRVTLAPALALSRFRRRINIAVVSPGLTAEQVEWMGFRYFASLEAALESILRDVPKTERRVDVVTHGGATYPYIKQKAQRST